MNTYDPFKVGISFNMTRSFFAFEKTSKVCPIETQKTSYYLSETLNF